MEPEFDGRFSAVGPLAVEGEAAEAASLAGRPAPLQPAELLPTAAATVMGLDAGKIVQHIGRPQTQHLDHAGQIVAQLPPSLLAAAREPFTAQGRSFALLFSGDDQSTLARQLQLLETQAKPPLYMQTKLLAAAVQSLSEGAALPLVNLSIPARKSLSPQQYAEFRRVVEALVEADHKVDLFEYSLRTVLFSYLDVHFGLKKPPAVRYRTADALAQPATVVLATLAYVGQSRPEEIERAFGPAAANLLRQPALPPAGQCTLRASMRPYPSLLRQVPS